MSELPEHWTKATLADLTEVIKNGLVSNQNKEGKGFPVTRIETIAQGNINEKRLGYSADLSAEAIENYRLMPGDILLSHINSPAHLGKTAVYRGHPSNLFHGMNLLLIRSNMSIVCPYYFEYGLKYLRMTGVFELNAQHAVNQASINQKKLKSFGLPLAPLNEQKRIADKLDQLLAVVDSCKTRLDTIPGIIKRFRQSVLAAATSGELTADWREELENNDWRTVTVGSLCEQSFYGPRFGKDEYTTDGIPTIRTTDMTRDGRIEITSSTPRVSVPANKLDNFKVEKGDLLITRTGSIGIMAVFDGDYVAMPSAYLIRFRFTKVILPRYMFYCLMAPAGQEMLGLSTTAITQPNINAEAIKRIKIELPSIKEQQEIVRRVEALFVVADHFEARYQTARAQVDQLTPSLLAKAFRGELVPQDPNDEPAEKLLERIRAKKDAAPTKQSSRRKSTL